MVAPVVTLTQVKTFLNISGTTDDDQLEFFIQAATDMWARRGGPVGEQADIDEWYDGGSAQITVRTTPVISVSYVRETYGSIYYTLLDQAAGSSGYAWQYTVDKATGTFVRRAAGIAVNFMNGVRNINIKYTAGYTTVPDDVQLAVLLLVKHLWTTQRGIGRRPGMGGDDDNRGEAYTWPNRVEEILANYKIPGIA